MDFKMWTLQKGILKVEGSDLFKKSRVLFSSHLEKVKWKASTRQEKNQSDKVRVNSIFHFLASVLNLVTKKTCKGQKLLWHSGSWVLGHLWVFSEEQEGGSKSVDSCAQSGSWVSAGDPKRGPGWSVKNWKNAIITCYQYVIDSISLVI